MRAVSLSQLAIDRRRAGPRFRVAGAASPPGDITVTIAARDLGPASRRFRARPASTPSGSQRSWEPLRPTACRGARVAYAHDHGGGLELGRQAIRGTSAPKSTSTTTNNYADLASAPLSTEAGELH